MSGGGGSAAFSPASLPNLAFWYDASQLTLANNDPVGSFTDLSGNGRHLVQATASWKPTFLTNRQNGLPAVVSDGTDDRLQTANFTFNQPKHIFVVVKGNSLGIQPALLDGGSLLEMWTRYTGGNIQMYAGSFGPTSSGIDLTLPHLLEFYWDGANSFIRVDGVTTFTGNPGANNATGLSVFSAPGATEYVGADLFELFGCTGQVTGANLSAAIAYVQAKWATP